MIITVGNTKGGVGKTTLAVQLAIYRALAGRDVWLIDGDRQGTAAAAIAVRFCQRAARTLLEEGGNTVLDEFLCQGKVNPQVVAASQRKGTHPMTAARQERLQEAARHPDENDLQAASQRWLRCLTAARAAFHQ